MKNLLALLLALSMLVLAACGSPAPAVSEPEPEPPEVLTVSGMVYWVAPNLVVVLQDNENIFTFPADTVEKGSLKVADDVTVQYTEEAGVVTVLSVEVDPSIPSFLIDPETGLLVPNPESPDYEMMMEVREESQRQEEEERQRQEENERLRWEVESLRQEAERQRQEAERLQKEVERLQKEADDWHDLDDDGHYDDEPSRHPQINWFGN